MIFRGHAEIRTALVQLTGPFDYLIQLNTPALIEINGDAATTQCVIRECARFTGRDEAMEVLGFYTDRLVRTPTGWKFARRVFEQKGLHRFTTAEFNPKA
jgi:hypothetical protein